MSSADSDPFLDAGVPCAMCRTRPGMPTRALVAQAADQSAPVEPRAPVDASQDHAQEPGTTSDRRRTARTGTHVTRQTPT